MSTLYLIRHGQAGFGQAEYDVLSPLGAEQSSELGRHLVAAELRIDALYCAPRRRHRETVQHMRSAAALPEPLPAPGFDEFPFAEILQAACREQLAAEYAELSANLDGRSPLADARSFVRLFRQSMALWLDGAIEVSESFAQFCARINSELQRIRSQQGHGQRVAIVTSAGAISAVLMQTLGLSGPTMLKLCLSLHNTGLSELRYRDGDLSVISVNAVPHLLRPHQRTFR